MIGNFGRCPNLVEYIGWANGQGCTTRSAVVIQDGIAVTVCRLKSKSGKHVIISGISNTEPLKPSQVAFFDRRLGLESPFQKE